jgi:RHS repeat-associated protein
MMKDDEVKGGGNSYDFGARMFDPRLGRWLSIDPHVKRYPGISPYHFSYNNPVIFNDPNGKDGRLTIDYENKTVTLETTVHIYGDGDILAGQAKAEFYNEMYGKMNNIAYVKDQNDPTVVWTVKIDVKFVYNDCLDEMMETIGEGVDDKPHEKTLNDFNQAGAEIPVGDNIYKIMRAGGGAQGMAKLGGSSAYGNAKFTTIIHEVFHNLGFDERYINNNGNGVTPTFFQGDILEGGISRGLSYLPRISGLHFVNLLDFSTLEYDVSGCYEIGVQIVPAHVHEFIDSEGMPTSVRKGESKLNAYQIDNTEGGRALTDKRVNEDSQKELNRIIKE